MVRRPGQWNKLLSNPTVEVTKSSTNENKTQRAIQQRKANYAKQIGTLKSITQLKQTNKGAVEIQAAVRNLRNNWIEKQEEGFELIKNQDRPSKLKTLSADTAIGRQRSKTRE